MLKGDLQFMYDNNNIICLLERKLKAYSPKKLYYTEKFIPSAVIIPLIYSNSSFKLLFTKRSNKVKDHKGEISFPGGVKEIGDKDLKMTALRETEEELGIQRDSIKIIGELDDYLTITGYIITPFVGILEERVPLNNYNKDEIDSIIIIDLEKLLDERVHSVVHRANYKIHKYEMEGTLIWGATAFILYNFLSIMREIYLLV